MTEKIFELFLVYEMRIAMFLLFLLIVVSLISLVAHSVRKRTIRYYGNYFVYCMVAMAGTGFCGLCVGLYAGFYRAPEVKTGGAFSAAKFWLVWDTVADSYYKKIDQDKMFRNVLKSVADSSEDEHTRYLTDEERAEQEKYEPGKEIWGYGFDCEGCYAVTPDGLEILAFFMGSSADRNGLIPGDKIISIDDYDLESGMMDKLEEPGAHTFKILEFYSGKVVELVLSREKLKIKGVFHCVDDGVAHIRIQSFEGDVAEEFEKAVEEILKEKPKGVILDLRRNLGGNLGVMLKIADAWIPGKVVLIERYPKREKELRAKKSKVSGKLKDAKTVILMDKNTASASEALIAALKYHLPADKLRLVGERTYGKCVEQTVVTLTDGSQLRVTIAEWENPGRIKFCEGIKPDYEVKYSQNSCADCQFDKAMEVIVGLK